MLLCYPVGDGNSTDGLHAGKTSLISTTTQVTMTLSAKLALPALYRSQWEVDNLSSSHL